MGRVWDQIGPDMRREIGGIVLIALGLVGYLALSVGHGWMAKDLGRALKLVFGWSAWLVPGLVVVAGGLRVFDRPSFTGHRRGWGAILAVWVVALATGLLAPRYGGYIGDLSVRVIQGAIGSLGVVVVGLVALAITAMLLTDRPFSDGARQGVRALAGALAWSAQACLRAGAGLWNWVFPVEAEEPPPPVAKRPRKARPPVQPRGAEPAIAAASDPVPEPPSDPPRVVMAPPPEGTGYRPPPLEILAAPGPSRPSRGQTASERAEVLRSALEQFGIQVKLGAVSQGPTITRFEIQPPPGVKVSRIVNLADDIALSLAATGVRIEAPIPGKSAIGIEVPNDQISPVLLREVLNSRAFADAGSPLAVGLGKDVAGEPIVAALDAMPHLLVAGATGSGKSVLINVLIASLLFRAPPHLVRLLLIDPKVVELSVYNGIPHLLTPVVTDPKKAAMALRWAVREMERRYRLFAESGVRDMQRFNQVASDEERLYYLVVIIDELADLMMVASAEVEESIARLAQMARAAGIHLVVATQRPSVDVITGTIKANIPSRIAFSVSSQVDSRTILDAVGAEKLLGRGDMLFHPVGAAKAQRLQGAYVGEKEIEQMVEWLRPQAEPVVQDQFDFESAEGSESGPPPETDPLFRQAVQIVVESRQASASMLQRRLRVGYTRAARLIDAMEERGFIGPQDGAKAREVRLSVDQFHRLFESPESPSA